MKIRINVHTKILSWIDLNSFPILFHMCLPGVPEVPERAPIPSTHHLLNAIFSGYQFQPWNIKTGYTSSSQQVGFTLPSLPKIQIWLCHFLASNPLVAPNAITMKSKRLYMARLLLLSQASSDAMLSSPPWQTQIPLRPTILSSASGPPTTRITLTSSFLPTNS